MKSKKKSYERIAAQLSEQQISHEVVSQSELKETENMWKNLFIGKLMAPQLSQHKWHIFSFNPGVGTAGAMAAEEYNQQHPATIYIFNEDLSFGLKCIKPSKLPQISLINFSDDVYICHHNMKWTYIIPHEFPEMGPYFCKRI